MRAMFAVLVSVSAAFGAPWSSGGPYGGQVVTLASAASNPRVIYAGNAGGVFRSDDGGTSWRNVGGSIREVRIVAVDPTNADIAYVAAGTRLYKTMDGGLTWSDASKGLPSGISPSALLIDPQHPEVLYIGGHCGAIFKSAQPQWHEFAGVYKSIDGGASWKRADAGLDRDNAFGLCIEELSLDPSSPTHLYSTAIFSPPGQFETLDGGGSWHQTSQVVPGQDIVQHPRFPLTRYGITRRLQNQPGFLVTNDGGFTWTAVTANGLPRIVGLYDLAIDPVTARLFLATYQGLYRSGDGGANWLPVSGAPQTTTYRVEFDSPDNRLLVATLEGLFYADAPGVERWSAADLHDLASDVMSVAVDPRNPAVVYASTFDSPPSGQPPVGRAFRSRDFGRSWELLPDDSRGLYTSITVDAAGDLYTIAYGGAVSKLPAGSDRWISRIAGGYEPIVADPLVPGVVFLSGRFLSRTRDGGNTWQTLEAVSDPDQIAIDPIDSRRVYVAALSNFMRSTDGGDTWTTTPVLGRTQSLVVAPSKPSVLYRICHELRTIDRTAILSTMYRSDDYGVTWKFFRHPADNNGGGLKLAVDPRDENVLYLASLFRGVFRSRDGGATWTSLNDGLLAPIVTSAVIDRAGMFLHVGTQNGGVWDLTLNPRRRAVR